MSTQIFTDEFDASNDPLETRTPNVGTSYTKEEDTTTGTTGAKSVKVDATTHYARIATATDSAVVLYSCQPEPRVADYDVEATVFISSQGTDDPHFVFGRMTATDTMYALCSYGSGSAADKKLYKIVSGTVTELGSSDSDFNTGDRMKLELRGTTINAYIDPDGGGYDLLFSVTDSSITSSGKWGIGWGNKFVATDDASANARFDDITLTEFAIQINVSDSITVSESVTVSNPNLGPISVNDAISVTESTSIIYPDTTKTISVSDSITITESVTVRIGIEINKSESITLTESVSLSIISTAVTRRLFIVT